MKKQGNFKKETGKFKKEPGKFKKEAGKFKKESGKFKKSSGKPSEKIRTKPEGKIRTKPEGKPRISTTPSEDIRLNKYIASSGICSRREADTYIKAGLITVNDQSVTEMGSKVKPGDIVKYNGQRIKNEKLVYVVLNKPKDFMTTTKDPHATRTVMDLVKNACKERIYPVGRLDRNTTGVLLLTNDGELTTNLTHPRHNKLKIYHVGLNKAFTAQDMKKIRDGIKLEDGFIQVDVAEYTDPVDKKHVGVEIHSGKNRIVRRIFEHLGYDVKKLDRVYFAGLTKKGITRGKWRFLSEKEVGMLKMGSYR